MGLDVAILGAHSLNNDGAPQIQVVKPVGDETNDVEPLGECDVMQALGVTSVPWPKDDKGHAEAVVATGCGGRDGIVVGARDNRCAGIYGKLDSGDTCVHTTDPDLTAQLLLKAKKRTAAITCKDSAGKTMLVSLDGKGDELQLLAFGMAVKMKRGDGVTITNGDGATILMQGDTISLLGNVILGGMTPNPAQCIMLGLPTGVITPSPGSPLPMTPAKGVFIG